MARKRTVDSSQSQRGGKRNKRSKEVKKSSKWKIIVPLVVLLISIGVFAGYKYTTRVVFKDTPAYVVEAYYDNVSSFNRDGMQALLPDSLVAKEGTFTTYEGQDEFFKNLLGVVKVKIPEKDGKRGTLMEDKFYEVEIPNYTSIQESLKITYTKEKIAELIKTNSIDIKSPAAVEDLSKLFVKEIGVLDNIPVKTYTLNEDSLKGDNETASSTTEGGNPSQEKTNGADAESRSTDASGLVTFEKGKKDEGYKITSDSSLNEVLFSSESFYNLQLEFNKLFGVNDVYIGWVGAYTLSNNENGAVQGISGEGTMDSPNGLGFPVRTQVLGVDGKLSEIRLTTSKIALKEEAIQYVERLDTRNRGFDPNSEQTLGVIQFKVENLTTKTITFDIPFSLTNKNGNFISRTGTVFGINKRVTLKAGESKQLTDWVFAPNIKDTILVWGYNFKDASKRVYFKMPNGK